VKYAVQRAILAANLMVLMLALPARAQLKVGDNASMNLSGNISFGYQGNYSNLSPSAHGMTPSGNADLSGYYYSPSFLSFDVQPFYNQSRDNSEFPSIFQSGGVTGNASIFSGSQFPGSISYSKVYNSEGGLSLPGVGNLVTRGNSDNLSLGWGINIPDYPHVQFQYDDGGSNNSVFGSGAESTYHTRGFGVVVADRWAGFDLSGDYRYNATSALTPQFLENEGPVASRSSSNSFDFSAGHKLPFQGAFSATAGRADVSAEASGQQYNGTIDTFGSGASFEPVVNLNVGVSGQYTNNLEGSIYQSVITSGGIVPSSLLNYSTSSLDLNSHAYYTLPAKHLTFGANADRREQEVFGTAISANVFSESVTYGADLLGGFFNASASLTETQVQSAYDSHSLGQFETASYSRRFQGWTMNGALNYSHNTQTVLIGYTASGYGYSGGIGRKFGPYSFWSVNAVGTKTKFSNSLGSENLSQSYSTSLTLRRFSMSGSYGKADGTSILTPTGLTPVTNPVPIVTPAELILFGGKSYSFGASTNPLHGLVLSGSYSLTKSNTAANAATSQNTTAQMNTMLQYKLRQLWITGGYLRLQQGFSITRQPMRSDSSFFVGITRWFKFF
jgi:hypothetical protein